VTDPLLSTDSPATSRRDFLKTSATVVGAGLLGVVPNVHAAGGDTLRIGLIGCGGRGTGAANQALRADPNLKLVAIGDMFPDRLQESLSTLKRDRAITEKVAVTPDTCFTGFDAYKKVIASGIDVVLLATPPHFRPAHIKAAVEAGKHIFAEKPVAVDGPGVRSVLSSCAEAKKKNLAIVSGLCWRYHNGMRETFKRIHDGAIGDIVTMHCLYNTSELWHRSLKEKQQKGWSDMEWQIRNWLYFTWLSGDHIVEQAVHSLDKGAWAMKDVPPIKAVGIGGRQVRTAPDFGHIFDHHSVVYQYENGVKLFHSCRQQNECKNETNDYFYGTKGTAVSMSHTITGANPWNYAKLQAKKDPSMYQQEHNELFASIRAGKPINDGEWMTKSTMLAIMGRMATYTGQEISWDKALNSEQDLTPAKYAFGPLEVPPVALPGITKFV
jgi:predicted dehydrogenase